MNQQKLPDALKAFEQALAINPQLVTARLNQGIALFNMQRLDEAAKALREVTEREPSNARAWYNLGLVYKTTAQAAPALEAFTHAAQSDPTDADSQYFIGSTAAQLQQYPNAIAAFERALALFPFHASAEFGLARAYQQSRNADKAREHLERFQHITKEKLGVPLSLGYGEQGNYSKAESMSIAEAASEPLTNLRFAPASDQAGLRFQHGGSSTSLSAFLGSGACFFDYDNDGAPDLFLINSGSNPSALYRNTGKGQFADATKTAHLDLQGSGLACSAADFDNDDHTDLAVSFAGKVSLFRNLGDGTFQDVTKTAGIQVDGLPMGLTFVDFDHDGDVDLYVTRFTDFDIKGATESFDFPRDVKAAGNRLFRNNGNGTFTDWTKEAGLAGADPSVGAVATDFNNDRAIDLLVTGWRKSPVIYTNAREGAFKILESWNGAMPATSAGAIVADFNKDGWMDIALTHWASPGFSLWRNIDGKRLEPIPLPDAGWTRGWGITAIDYDNDGWLDIAAVGDTRQGSEIRLFRNRGTGAFDDVTSSVRLDQIKVKNPRTLIAADYDADGDADLLVTQNGGPALLLRNDGGNQHSSFRVTLKGLNDNKAGVGAKVELFAGRHWQKWEAQAGSGYLGQNSSAITAGLLTEKKVDIVRMLWPTGVLQDELEFTAPGSQMVNEIDRRGSSCPVLFAWNGDKYEFISDTVGAGVIGHWIGPGERNISDPDEYIKVDGSRLKLRDGKFSFRFMEPMEEVIYLDKVRLLAIDHPDDVEVYPNEYFAGDAPFPSFKVITSRGARPPKGAWDGNGHDVLPQLLARDGKYVMGFTSLPYQGFAESHALELELGDLPDSRPLRLIMHGFIDYPSDTSLFAAYQGGVIGAPLLVDAQLGSGKWVRLPHDIGFPAGTTRTMVADLTGRLPRGAHRIRLTTNLKIYWDQILVDNTAQNIPVKIVGVPLDRATLEFHGYPRQVFGNPASDMSFVYEDVSPTGPYARQAGSYTAFGDVTSLVSESDDKFAVFGSGEEVALEFDPNKLVTPRSGIRRDYFFYADAYTKDMDFYAAYSDTVEPLPFHKMGRYPARRVEYPSDLSHLEYRLAYNTREVAGKAIAGFKLLYRSRPH